MVTLEQIENLLDKTLDKKLSPVDRQLGQLHEINLRQAVEKQFGASFAKNHVINSLQQVAKLLCKSTGWPGEFQAADIYRVSLKLAEHLVSRKVPEKTVRHVWDALQHSPKAAELVKKPWFVDDELDARAFARSLSSFPSNSKLAKQLQMINLCFQESSEHLIECRSAGVLLAAQDAAESQAVTESQAAIPMPNIENLLPHMQLQIDVRGRITIVKHHVTIEVGEIKRGLKKYADAKKQVKDRVKLLQWAIKAILEEDDPLYFVLIGHIFSYADNQTSRSNEIEDGISIFTHLL